MFTGLIREFGEVTRYQSRTLCIKARHKAKIGDSIAVNGACLTVVELSSDGFCVELSEESEALLATENLTGRVHIEPAMQLSDRIEGHMVQGHIDATGIIQSITTHAGSSDFFIKATPEILALIIPKGSVSIDGVSLTVNEVLEETFRLTIIPHTFEKTLFGGYAVGRRVNIETDIIARTVQHFLQGKKQSGWDAVDRILATY